MVLKSLKVLLALAPIVAFSPAARAAEAAPANPPRNGSLTKHQSHKAHPKTAGSAAKPLDKPKGQAAPSPAPIKGRESGAKTGAAPASPAASGK